MPRTEAGKALAILVPGNYSDLVATIDAIEAEARNDADAVENARGYMDGVAAERAQHRCIPDRDALIVVLHRYICGGAYGYSSGERMCARRCDVLADAIIAALEEQP